MRVLSTHKPTPHQETEMDHVSNDPYVGWHWLQLGTHRGRRG